MPRKNRWVKPYLKWAGGKRQLLPEIKKYLPARIGTYYEPFIGAGAVLFDRQPRRAVINDTNEQLIATYHAVKENVEDLIALLLQYEALNSAAFYYEIRGKDREPAVFQSLSGTEKAARLIYLNKTCYNGLYRVNSQGFFNVPYGRYANPCICESRVLRAVSRYLNRAAVEIRCGDFVESLADIGPRSFVYFDPPYHSADKSSFTGYQAGGFGDQDQLRLRNAFAELSRRRIRCLLSNADTAFIREIYQGFDITTVQARRAINSNSDGRGHTNELLIRNYR